MTEDTHLDAYTIAKGKGTRWREKIWQGKGQTEGGWIKTKIRYTQTHTIPYLSLTSGQEEMEKLNWIGLE